MGVSTAPRPRMPESTAPAPAAGSSTTARPVVGVTVAARPQVVTSTAPRPRMPETTAPAGHIPPAIVGVVVRALTVEIDVDVLVAAWQIQYAPLTAGIAVDAQMPSTLVPVLERGLTVELQPGTLLPAWQIQYAALTAEVQAEALLPVLGDELTRQLVAQVAVEVSIPAVVVHTRSLVVEIPVDVDVAGTVVLSRALVAEVPVTAVVPPTEVHTRALVAEVAPGALAPAAPVLERTLVAEVPIGALTPPTPVHTRALVAEITPTATAPGAVVTFVAMGVDKNGTQDPGRSTWTKVTGWTVRTGYPGTVESGGALIAEGSSATTIHAQVKFNTGAIFISKGVRLKVNGTVVATSQDSASKTTYTLTYATTLSDGDVVTIEAYHSATTTSERNVLAGAANTFLYFE